MRQLASSSFIESVECGDRASLTFLLPSQHPQVVAVKSSWGQRDKDKKNPKGCWVYFYLFGKGIRNTLLKSCLRKMQIAALLGSANT